MRRPPIRFTTEEKAAIWDRLRAGESTPMVAVTYDRHPSAIRSMLQLRGGVRPRPQVRSKRHLSLEEREEISRGVAAGRSLRAIAGELGRSPSTVSRELRRNGGAFNYRACRADRRAYRKAKRPKAAKLARCPRLRRVVESKLERHWSPQQISRWLAMEYPDRPEMQVSHETIYLSLYVQGRGALRHELHNALRTGRALRKPKYQVPTGKGQINDMVMISERPPEVEDRAVPGHWEGDLILGTKGTAIGTLVERTSRYVMLLKLRDLTAEETRQALTKRIVTLPTELRRSITWDQGREMAFHRKFTIDTGVKIYFCDPKSPWQRGSNENTNGLLRQYFPKATNLSVHSQAKLNAVARELNGRPRQTLDWMTPSQRFAEIVASTS